MGEEAAAAALLAPWRRRGCERVASAEEEEEPSRGEPAETKITAASRWRVTPLSVGQELRWRECGKPKEPMGRGKNGELPSIVSAAVAILSIFVPSAFAPQLSWIAPDSLPPVPPSLPH